MSKTEKLNGIHVNGVKNAIMQVIYLNGPMVNLLFYLLLMRIIATILLLTSKFSGKFQRFSTIDGSIEMLKNR